jgi:hypothetical protein
MCIQNNAIEHQIISLTKQILTFSIYKPLHLDVLGQKRILLASEELTFEHSPLFSMSSPPLITHVTLQDENGKRYNIEPNENGLKFASGDISYQQYLRSQNNENRKLIGLSLVFLTAFLAGSWGLFRLLL